MATLKQYTSGTESKLARAEFSRSANTHTYRSLTLHFPFVPPFCSHFLKALQKCLQNPYELGPLIKRSERKLHMYVVYCQNKPVSEHIVQEHMSYFDELRLKLKYKLCVSIWLM